MAAQLGHDLSVALVQGETATVDYRGTFSGTSILHGILIIQADGRATFHDSETFTGTVNGESGAVRLDLSGSGSVVRPTGSFHGAPLGSTAFGPYNQVIGTGKYYLQQEWSDAANGGAGGCVQTGP